MLKLNQNYFIRSSSVTSQPQIISISDFMGFVKKHEGLFIVEDIEYDSINAGKDNLYFSYCFNYNNGKAINETLFIIDEIMFDKPNQFIITAQNKQYSVFFKV